MSERTSIFINRLLRGISTNHVQTVRQAWRDLLEDREAAAPLVREKLDSDAWLDAPTEVSVRYLGVLLALLHELDAVGFKKEVDRLNSAHIHPLHRRIVAVMGKRHDDQIFGTIGGDVPVYISGEIEQPGMVFSLIECWAKTRDLAISDVTRVDVISRRPEMDFLGAYNLLFDGIVLVWQNDAPTVFANWWRKMRTELTFFHEVGHHYFQHSERGQVEKQEQEADDYQWKMFRNAHPRIWLAVRIVFFPFLITIKISRYFSGDRKNGNR